MRERVRKAHIAMMIGFLFFLSTKLFLFLALQLNSVLFSTH